MIKLIGIFLRWTLFIPLALGVGGYAEIYINRYLHELLPSQILISVIIYIIAAILFCVLYLAVGTWLSPIRHKYIKYILGSILLLMSVAAFAAPFIAGNYNPYGASLTYKYGILIRGIIGLPISIYFISKAGNRYFFRN